VTTKVKPRRNFLVLISFLCLGLAIVPGCGPAAGRQPLLIFAGSACKQPLDEAARAFQQRTGIPVTLTYGGSGTLLSQMILAKAGDLFIPASQDFMDTAETRGVVDPGTRRTIAYLLPVIAVQKGNPLAITTLEDLTLPGRRVGIANPDTVVAGALASEILNKAGIWSKTQPNIVVQAKSADDLASILALGQVDAVIGWDVFSQWWPEKVTVIALPAAQLTRAGSIVIAISTYTTMRQDAQRFLDFITSAGGQAIFSRNGFQISEPSF
jgi:molybdate transport system substrate-binding protein